MISINQFQENKTYSLGIHYQGRPVFQSSKANESTEAMPLNISVKLDVNCV